MNNLYGWAMMQPLPVGDFKWMDERELEHWEDFPCILEVDLDYPKDLHDLHNDYPLAPERLKIGGVEKLIPNLWEKKKYVLHHKNLKLYQELGLKLKKIHRGIKFREEPRMKSYIELNTDLRRKGKNDFEKDFFKLMNNSVFGKTMENIRNLNLKHWIRFDENLIAVHLKRIKLVFDKPVYCGMAILDISKTLIYDFHMVLFFLNMEKIKNFSSWIRILSAMKLKQKISLRIFQGMLKKVLTRAIFQKITQVEFRGKTKKFLE